jgi:hypothetical protein
LPGRRHEGYPFCFYCFTLFFFFIFSAQPKIFFEKGVFLLRGKHPSFFKQPIVHHRRKNAPCTRFCQSEIDSGTHHAVNNPALHAAGIGLFDVSHLGIDAGFEIGRGEFAL